MDNRFAEKLKALRTERGISAGHLSSVAGVSLDTYLSWESGEAFPPLDKAARLTDALGVSLDELTAPLTHQPKLNFGKEDDESPAEKQGRLEEIEAEHDRLWARGRRIVKGIVITEAIFIALSFLTGNGLLNLILSILIIVFLWKGKTWARWLFVGLRALGILGDLILLGQMIGRAPGWLLILTVLLMAYEVLSAILIVASRAVEEFLYDQDTN